jgi:hypothetical protein
MACRVVSLPIMSLRHHRTMGQSYYELLEGLLMFHPPKRFTAKQALEHEVGGWGSRRSLSQGDGQDHGLDCQATDKADDRHGHGHGHGPMN